ncbi:MAG: hypothetical protein ACK4NC_01990 [Candidatus Gracilibacteria bacterium]
MKPESDPLNDISDNEESTNTVLVNEENIGDDGDLLSPILIYGLIMVITITAGVTYKINTLLKKPDSPDSVMQETLQAINKGYVSESEMTVLSAKLHKQLSIHKDNTQLMLHLGDLYRTNFEYRKAYLQYQLAADSKDQNEAVMAIASINGLLVDAFPKSFRDSSKKGISEEVRKDCLSHPEKETPECTKITFSTFCAKEQHQRIMKNCQLFKEPYEVTEKSTTSLSTSDK